MPPRSEDGGHLVGAADERQLVAEVQVAVPVGQAIGVDLARRSGLKVIISMACDQAEHDVGGALALRIRARAASPPGRPGAMQRSAHSAIATSSGSPMADSAGPPRAERVDHLPA